MDYGSVYFYSFHFYVESVFAFWEYNWGLLFHENLERKVKMDKMLLISFVSCTVGLILIIVPMILHQRMEKQLPPFKTLKNMAIVERILNTSFWIGVLWWGAYIISIVLCLLFTGV
jgi:hypothetical protein